MLDVLQVSLNRMMAGRFESLELLVAAFRSSKEKEIIDLLL